MQRHAKSLNLLKEKLAAKTTKEAAEKDKEKKETLKTMGFTKRVDSKEFFKDSALKHTVKFIACTSQVSTSSTK